jgi:hypothetical protein
MMAISMEMVMKVLTDNVLKVPYLRQFPVEGQQEASGFLIQLLCVMTTLVVHWNSLP